MGMLAIRLFLSVVKEYYDAISNGNERCAVTTRAPCTFEKKLKRITSGAANADIRRVLQTIKQRTQSTASSGTMSKGISR